MAENTFERRLALPVARPGAIVAWLLDHREMVALGSIMLVAGLLRFYQLDAKALHHDESLHANFTWLLYKGQGYHHDPLMHGPFLFEAGAVGYFLFGDSDFTARIVQALFGTVLVGMPFLLRKQIGMRAVLIAAVMITVSPTLLYVSRFDRHDIYIVTWMMGMTICAWRYLDERRIGWMYAFSAIVALSFATMEMTFINVAIMLVFLDLMLAYELGKQQPGENVDKFTPWLRIVALAPVAWAVAALWPFLGQRPFGRFRMPPVGDVLLILGTLSLPQFAAAIQELPFVGDKGYEVAAENNLRNATLISLIAASAFVGIYWRPKTWLICALMFWVPWILLYTTFFTNVHGLFSGSWGSLDYWLDQQDVARGGQPKYYYMLLTPLYEFMPLILGLAGSAWLVAKGTSLKRWLVFWLAGIFVGLSLAGEKMPWLEVHIALPLCLVAAVALAGAIDRLEFTSKRWETALAVSVVAAVSTLLLVEGPGVAPYAGLIGMLGVIGWGLVSLAQQGTKAAARVALTIMVATLFTLTVRTSLTVSFTNPDVPVEMLVYTQSSPEIPEIARRIDTIAKNSGMGYNLPISVDGSDSFSWPWAWYLRDYKDVLYVDARTPGFVPRKGGIFLLNRVNLPTFDTSGYTQTPYKHRWWFLEDGYRGLTVSKVASIATSPSDLKSLAKFFLYRHPAEGHTGSVDAVALIPLQFSQYDTGQKEQQPAAKAQRLPDGRLVFGKSGIGPGELQQPEDVFVDRAGTIWVADGKNNRINHYDAQGNFMGALGPFAAAPAALDEPWGVAVDETGVIYVADTWHHRIVKFSPSMQYITSWGEPATKPNPGPLELFGPRDIAFGEDGTLWVTDTGSNRLINFTRNGEPIAVFGQAGNGPSDFAEPVSLARDDAGRVYVADAWNGRILRFQRGMVVPESFPTTWTSHEVIAKPYIAVLADGRILASDPGNGTLLLLDPSGKRIGAWKPSEGSTPIGVAAMPDGGFVFSDASPGREQVQVVPVIAMPALFK